MNKQDILNIKMNNKWLITITWSFEQEYEESLFFNLLPEVKSTWMFHYLVDTEQQINAHLPKYLLDLNLYTKHI